MSLQLAIQQIQTPSFWGANTTGQTEHSQNRDRRKDNDFRRKKLLEILRCHGGPMDYATMEEMTGWTWFSLRNLLNTLEDSGKVHRSKIRVAGVRVALVEAI